jgi:hydroxymethylglutaryl-CoA reductase
LILKAADHVVAAKAEVVGGHVSLRGDLLAVHVGRAGDRVGALRLGRSLRARAPKRHDWIV